MDEPFRPTEAEIDAVIAEFEGNLRAAIAALLHDLAMLAADFDRSVSRGYRRGRAIVITLPGTRREEG